MEDRNALVVVLLNRLNTLPLNESIVFGQNSIKINGKDLDIEQMISFKESCVVLKDNWARKVLTEQIKYLAVNMGIYKSVDMNELFFAKAALWCIAEENKLLDLIV